MEVGAVSGGEPLRLGGGCSVVTSFPAICFVLSVPLTGTATSFWDAATAP